MDTLEKMVKIVTNQYGFTLNMVIFLILPIILVIIFIIKFYKNKKIIDDLATEYNINNELRTKLSILVSNLPNLLSKEKLQLQDISKLLWTKEKDFLGKINKFELDKVNKEIKCYLAKLFVELLILVIILYHWNIKPKENAYSVNFVLYSYVVVKSILFYISTTHPSMNAFVLSEVITSEIDTDKDYFVFGNSIVNMVVSLIFPYAIYNIVGFKNMYISDQYPWHIVLIGILLIYSICNSIFNLNRLAHLNKNDTIIKNNNVNKVRLMTILLMKEHSDSIKREEELAKLEKLPDGILDNILYSSSVLGGNVVSRVNKSFGDDELIPSFGRVGNLVRDSFPPIYPSRI